jgi:arylsulfatase A-like enzyme
VWRGFIVTSCLYVDIDSLRADHVGAYGYERPTTPRLNELSEHAIRFERAYVANSPCMPSRAALLTGRYGVHNGVETHGPRSQQLATPATAVDWAGSWQDHVDARRWWTTPELFYKNRIPTAAVTSFPRHPATWFTQHWHELYQPQEPAATGETFQTPRAENVVPRANSFLKRHDDREFFLYVQFWDPHGPYNRTAEEVDAFRSGPLPEYPTAEQIETHRSWDAWRSATQMGIEDRCDLAGLVAGYDAEIRHVDRHVGRLLDCLRSLGRYEDTTVVVTADHGEEFGEHGLYREHWSTHDGTQRVPLIIKPPASAGVDSGVRDQLVTNVDIPPTLATLAGFDVPESWQGCSLEPVVRSAATNWRDAIVVDHGLYTAQRAVRTDRWKYIHTFDPGMWSGVVPEQQLYRIEQDPFEQENVAADYPSAVSKFERLMTRWARDHADSAGDELRAVARDGPSGTAAFEDRFEGV